MGIHDKIYVGRLFMEVRFSGNFNIKFLVISAKIPWKFKGKQNLQELHFYR